MSKTNVKKVKYVGPSATVSTPQGEYVFNQGEWVEVESKFADQLLEQPTFIGSGEKPPKPPEALDQDEAMKLAALNAGGSFGEVSPDVILGSSSESKHQD